MAKLVVIGDSLTQGFQSGAISRTELSYPALIARSMGLAIPSQFPIPSFPGGGLPFNIEEALRVMEKSLGAEISTLEWVFRFPTLLHDYVDRVEDLYERGAGSRSVSFGGSYHNLAVWGFKVVDSLAVNAQYCDQAIQREEGWVEDDFIGLPSGAMYRTAKRVLNPNANPQRATWTQLDHLRAIVEQEGELESLILWLGANDCLGTVVDLKLKDMSDGDVQKLQAEGLLHDPMARRKWNLTNLNLFRQDFERLVGAIAAIIPASTKVFVGTVPHVTIPPITQGIGALNGQYYKYYGSFYANPKDSNAPPRQRYLTGKEVITIDQRIDAFNQVIRDLVKGQGGQWRVVNTCAVLDELAVKRNKRTNAPGLPLVDYYTRKGRPDHPLLQLSPIPSVLRFDTENAIRLQGGLFSLDCIHPTTIGYGIVAEEFLEAMQGAGIPNADPLNLDWESIIGQDTLIQSPPVLWDDILMAAQNNALIWDLLLSFTT